MSSDNKPLTMSPDNSRGVFIRNWNLWVKEMASGQETQLTTDGIKDFGYATNNAGWVSGENAIGLWSPDSKKFATQQQDERGVGHMYLVTTPTGGQYSTREGGHPLLKDWAYPLPGDSIITTIQRVIIDVPSRKVIRLQMPTDQHRGSVTDNLNMNDLKWRPDGSELVFLSSSRDHKTGWLRSANATTGAVREVFHETVPTQFESAPSGQPLWTVIWPTNEVLWYSKRDNWGHFYLYDMNTGTAEEQGHAGRRRYDGRAAHQRHDADAVVLLGRSRAGTERLLRALLWRSWTGPSRSRSRPTSAPTARRRSSPDGKYLVANFSQDRRAARQYAAKRARQCCADSRAREGRRSRRNLLKAAGVESGRRRSR